MFENLEMALARKKLSKVVVASTIGCSEKSLYNKLNGQTEFTLSEILTISRELLPEYRLDYLFEKKSA